MSQPGQKYTSSITVTLRCGDYNGCASTFYCLGEGCDPATPYAQTPIKIAESTSLRFYSVDKASNTEAVKTETYNIVFPDLVAPVAGDFIVPSIYRALSVPVLFYATDNVGVTGYCVTESSDPETCSWTMSPPTLYTFTAAGPHTLYAYARDAGGNVSAPVSATVSEDQNLIRLQQATDMVYAKDRGILYITSGGSILRYQVASRSFLSPYQTSGTLSGIDVAPDGGTVAVADESRTSIHLVNLDNGSIVAKAFTPSSGETGIHNVAFGADGSLLISSKNVVGTGNPLRRYDPATGEVSVFADVRAATVVANAGRSCVGIEDGGSQGTFGIYDVATRQIVKSIVRPYGSQSSNAGISRDCSQLANSGQIFSGDPLAESVFLSPVLSEPGVVYHPNADVLFIGVVGSSTVSAYETRTFRSVGTYDSGSPLGYGPLRIASDGSLLFARTTEGIQIIPLAPLLPQNQVVVTNQGVSVPIRLKAAAQQPNLSFQVDTPPQHGSLTGTAPDLTYNPDTSYVGSDSFTFKVSDGHGQEGSGTVTITVAHDVIPPVITAFTVPASSPTPVVSITSLNATDNIGVTGYCLTTSNSTYNCAWSDTPPASFDFTGTYNVYTPHSLYLFARDAAGNVSEAASALVSINTGGPAPAPPGFTLPPLSNGWMLTPALRYAAPAGTKYCATTVNDLAQCSPSSWNTFVGSHTFEEYGPHTLYLFAMSPTGVVSAPASATTTVVGGYGREIVIPSSYTLSTGVAYDPGRHTVYIARQNKLLRFDMEARDFLSPYLEGKALAGVDISPDGTTLVAGNATGVGIHLVDLRTGTSSQVDFTPVTASEPKTYGVTFTSDGAVIVTGAMSYGGSTPVRRYDPATGDVQIITTVTNGWELSVVPSPGGECVAVHDATGDRLFDSASQTFSTAVPRSFSSLFPNRDCSQFAIGSGFYDAAGNFLGTVPSPSDVRLAYDPLKDVVYSMEWNTVTAYDTKTFTKVGSFRVQGSSAMPGVSSSSPPIVVSRDGSYLFALYLDGVGYAKLNGPVAEEESFFIKEGAETYVTLLGRSSRNAALTYRIVTVPAHGTLSGTGPNIVYTPESGYLGKDSFTFSVSDGTEESDPATVTMTMRSSQPNAMTANLTLPDTSTSPMVPVTIYGYGNSTADSPTGPVSWCLTEAPSAASCAWRTARPAFYEFRGEFPQGVGVLRVLYLYIMDGTGKVSRPGSDSVVITSADTAAPEILGLDIPQTYPSLSVPFTLLAGDNLRADFYCLSETDSPTGCSWQNLYSGQLRMPLTSYGYHTVYAFARDGGGNISASSSGTVYAYKPPRFTTAPTPSFLVGRAASYSIVADGYPVPTLTLSGSLPAGVLFTANGDGTAFLSGVPEPGSAGVYPVTVTADIGIGAPATLDFTITVARVKQTMTFAPAPIPSKVLGDPPFSITAVASSGLPVTITSSNPSVAVVEGAAVTVQSTGGAVFTADQPGGTVSTVTLRSAGYTVITADQPGDGTYEPASVAHVLNVGTRRVESVLEISALRDGDTTNVMVMNLAGKVAEPGNLVSLTVNGSAVTVSDQGFFSAAVGLLPGPNVVTTVLVQKDGSSVTDVRSIKLAGPQVLFDLSTPGDNAVVSSPEVTINGTGGKGDIQVFPSAGPPFTVTAEANGAFAFTTTLVGGLNTVLVSSADDEGNLFTAKRTLRHDSDNPSLNVGYPDQDAVLFSPYRGPAGFELKGETGPGSDISVTVEAAGTVLTPHVYNGRFDLGVYLPRAGRYPVRVTATAKGGGSSSTVRNILFLSAVPDGIVVAETGKTAPNLADALRVLRIAVGAISPTLDDFAHGDVAPLNDGAPASDGRIGVEDALLILERVVGLVTW